MDTLKGAALIVALIGFIATCAMWIHIWDSTPNSDRILQPSTKITLCYKVPELSEKIDPATLAWSAQRDSVEFAGG